MLLQLFGFGEDGVESEPCAKFIEILEDKETAEEGLIAFFADDGILSFDLLQKFPFIGGDRSDEGIALGGDHFFEGVAIDGWVLFLEAAVEQNEEIADVTTADGAKPIASFLIFKYLVEILGAFLWGQIGKGTGENHVA